MKREESLPFNEIDMTDRRCLKSGLFLEGGDIPDRLKDVHRFLEKTQDIGRVDRNPVFLEQERRDLPVVKAVLAEFNDLPGKFLLWTPAMRGFTTFAAEEGSQEREDLVTENMIKAIDVHP